MATGGGIKNLAAKTAGVVARHIEPQPEKDPRSAPVQIYDITNRMHDAEQKVQDLLKELAQAKTSGELRDLPLIDLHETPGRRRKLPDQEYSELKESIRANGLRDRIKVRPNPNGLGWEVISGHNRKAILIELDFENAPCLIQNTSDIDTVIDAFFANLYQSELPPYEKFVGFKAWMEVEPELNVSEISRRTGKPRSVVSELMAFAELPAGAHSLLETKPDAVGYRAAAKFAAITKAGHSDLVVEAIRSIAEEGVEQGVALRKLEVSLSRTKPATKKSEPAIVHSGRSVYCNMLVTAKVLRIEFESKDEAETIKEAVMEVLRRRAEEIKGKKK